MSGNVGFDLEKNTQLIINNLKIQNASTAILSNNNSATTDLTNTILANNIIAINNEAGTFNIKQGSVITASNGPQTNSVRNNDRMTIDNSAINSVLTNTNSGTLITANTTSPIIISRREFFLLPFLAIYFTSDNDFITK